MFLSLIYVAALICPICAGNAYTRRKLSKEAWSGIDTGIIVGPKFAPVHFTSMMTAMLECAIKVENIYNLTKDYETVPTQCDETLGCGIFKIEETEEDGVMCSMAELLRFTFLENASGPELEVFIRNDLLKEPGNFR